MKLREPKSWGTAFLATVMTCTMATPLNSQQGPCATQIGPKMPDLIVDQDLLKSPFFTFVTDENFGGKSCTVQEGCISSPGKHQLLRFNASTANIGKTALVIGDPANCGSLYEFSECHQHYHFKAFADYRLWTPAAYATWLASRDLTQPANVGINSTLLDMARQNGQLVAGRKQGFCMIDGNPFLPNVGPPVFQSCSDNQGLSVGWEDQYAPQIPCQFLEIDGLADGDYVLEVQVNPDQILPESDYRNNAGAAKIHFTPKHGNTPASIQIIG